MAETLGPGVLDDPFAPDLSLEERLRALESAWAEPGPVHPGADRHLADQSARLEALAAEVAAQRERLRDQEKAMVERIADVDDDRRLTSSQLQRGWQAQREELETRWRRHNRAGLLVLALALAGVGLFALYAHTRHTAAAAALASLRQEVQRLSGIAQQETELQERVAALAATVGELSSRPRRGGKAPDPGPGAEGTVPAERLERLAAEQRRQSGELEALQRGLQSLVTAMPSRPGPTLDGPPVTAPDTGARPKPATPEPEPAPVPAARPEDGPDATAPVPPRITKTSIMDRPFALQLMGGYSRDKILELALRPDLPDPVYLSEETRRGRPWFVLIHSLHANRAEAQAALAKLPTGLRSPSPWIRDLPRGTDLESVKRGAAPH